MYGMVIKGGLPVEGINVGTVYVICDLENKS